MATTYTTKGGTVYTAPRNPGSATLASGGFGAGTRIVQTTDRGTATGTITASGTIMNTSGSTLTVKPVASLPTTQPEVKNMATAGQSIGTNLQNIYNWADQNLASGLLPGGAPVDTAKLKTAALVAGGVALGAGVGYAGYQLYKYYTKSGQARKIKKNGQPYKRPSMNYNNPKALQRSERRLKSYIKHARSHVSALGYTITRKHHGGN